MLMLLLRFGVTVWGVKKGEGGGARESLGRGRHT